MPSTWREAIHTLLDETPGRGLVHYVDLAAALGERWPYRFSPAPGRRTPQSSVWRELNGDEAFRACGGGLFRYVPWGEAGEAPLRLSRDGGEALRAATAELRGSRRAAGPEVLEALLDDPERRAEEVARRRAALDEARALLLGPPLDAAGVLALMRCWSATGGRRPGHTVYNRFAPAFVGTFPATYAEHAAVFDEWVRELVEATPDQVAAALDRLWARNDLPLAGKLLPSMVLHTLAPDEHFPWTNRLASGLRAAGFAAGGGETDGEGYLRFAEGARAYVKREGLDPHLCDAALLREAARRDELEPAPPASEWEALAAFPATSFHLIRDVAAEPGGPAAGEGARSLRGAYRRAVREPLEQLARVVAARVIEPLLNAPNVLGGWAVETDPARVLGRAREAGPGGAGALRPYLSATFYPRAQGRRQQAVKLFLLVHPEGLDVGLSLDGAPEVARERLRHALSVAGRRLVAHQRLSPLWGRFVVRGLRPEGGAPGGAERPVRSLDDLRAFGEGPGASVLALTFGPEEAGRREVADWCAEAARVLSPLFALAVSDAPEEVLDAMGVARGVDELWLASERASGAEGAKAAAPAREAAPPAGERDGAAAGGGREAAAPAGEGERASPPERGAGAAPAEAPGPGEPPPAEGRERDELDAPASYGREELQRDTGLPAPWLERVVRAACVGEGRDELGQVILYGPPGTGKTFIAERVALHLVDGDRGRVELVQFHPAFGYENFVEGYRPETGPDGNSLLFKRADGVLLDLVARVARTGRRHVLLIDEINRGDLPQIFGELMYLLARRREQASVQLARSRRPLSLPHCLSIVATMNVADRSVAHLDFALRRRFAFFEVAPSPQVLTERLLAEGADEVSAGALGDLLGEVNRRLSAEPPGGLALGHAYFFGVRGRDELRATWEREIFPLLEDYFDYQPDRLAPYRWPAIGALFASFVEARGGQDDEDDTGPDGGPLF
ncbi:MAG TPA: AAA family ATPase [Polyangiaceae bacterium]|nr:AAA family ATPase [Polyangiaceae bacterium]